MSGICGIVNFDGKPVDPELLKRMAEAAAYRGPDGINYWIKDNVGFAHLALHTTPESVREHQPLINRRGDIVLTADARVDNRDNLISILTSKGYLEEKDPTDADLILSAYDCWGEDCPKYIIGDFAFALWSASKHHLFCARDPMGVRSLFYHQHGKHIYFSTTPSSIQQILKSRELNEPFILNFLCWRFDLWHEQTIYRSIFRVPARHTMLFSEESTLQSTEYWDLGGNTPIRYKSDEAYIAHFCDLFSKAVLCRTRSTTPVSIAMSGGLDSSSIACMAYKHRQEGKTGSPDITLLSINFHRFPEGDESEYREAVVQKCKGYQSSIIPEEAIWAFAKIDQWYFEEPPMIPLIGIPIELLKAAHGYGNRVLLHGEYGDHILNSNAYFLPHMMLDVRLKHLLDELPFFWRYSSWRLIPDILKHTAKKFVRLYAPSALAKSRSRPIAPNWIRTDKITAIKRQGKSRTFSTQSAAHIYATLTNAYRSAVLSFQDSTAAHFEAEYRYPYLDRRLIDFQLSVPPHLLFRRGLSKIILRKAMVGILPESVRIRTQISHITKTVHLVLQQEIPEIEALLTNARVDQARYLNPTVLSEEMLKLSSEEPDIRTIRTLLAPILLETWLIKHGSPRCMKTQ